MKDASLHGMRHAACGRQTGKQANRQTGKQANRQTGIVHTPDAVCALRIAHCALRIAYCVLRIAYCVLRVAGCTCILRIVRVRTECRARKKPSPQAAPTHSSPCALPQELPYRLPCSPCTHARASIRSTICCPPGVTGWRLPCMHATKAHEGSCLFPARIMLAQSTLARICKLIGEQTDVIVSACLHHAHSHSPQGTAAACRAALPQCAWPVPYCLLR